MTENIKSSSDIEKQKILWNKWIERHRNISEKLNKVLTEKLPSTSEECVSEETINYISLINTEKLQQKENYKELYKYIKKKIIDKNVYSCSYVNIRRIYKRENTIEYINSNIENKRNKEFHTHIGKDSFRNQIEDCTGEDDLYSNSIVNNGTVEKSIDIEEKHIS
ncbi:hypothetical protein MKS88_002588 [Plasmodium brasilianum]|uniref:Uncharacterized protein n=1 Tax=Plasmodium brasilianum TaxID=5824 RepID=A0ACB9YC67_PLABR|nr:hypothetical protein MKS88_002588 [Plasmodium brasilianum]